MRLIIKQFLSLLKESGELDILLPDLLLSMGVEPISRAQVGVRQFGVDLTAVGNDENGKKTFFIFVIKEGNIGRTDWDGKPQSVRPSLDEIKDVYLLSHIEKKYQRLSKKIIVCTGGERKQEIEANWTGYVNKNAKEDVLEYDFWGGDKLSFLIEKHLFNEKVIPSELQSRFRKALALLGDPDYNLSDYYHLLNNLLLETPYGDPSKKITQKKIVKAIRTVNISQNIIFFWANNEENLKPAIYSSERALLISWELIRRSNLSNNKKVLEAFNELYVTLFRIYAAYFRKIRPYCCVRNGFSGYGRHAIQENLNIFEQLGFISVTGLLYLFQGIAEESNALLIDSKHIAMSLDEFLENHPGTLSPCYDNHIIEISSAILLLRAHSGTHVIDRWIKSLLNQIIFAYTNMGQYFPIESDSFDDLVALNVSKDKSKEELFQMSTLLPILGQWCITLNLDDAYKRIREAVTKFFPNCTLQIWYPDSETDKSLYIKNAGRTGAVDAPLELHHSLSEMKDRMKKVQKNTSSYEEISALKYGLPILPIIASRHYRTPFLPTYWHQIMS